MGVKDYDKTVFTVFNVIKRDHRFNINQGFHVILILMNCFFLRSSDAKISTCSTTGVSDE
jgi:hypothetical protein